MQYFPLLDFQHLVLAIFLGLGFVILICIAFCSYKQDREEMSTEELDRLARGELAEAHDPEGSRIAPVLIIIYLGVIVWSVAYFVVVGIKGSAF
jgi:hypothetical protein